MRGILQDFVKIPTENNKCRWFTIRSNCFFLSETIISLWIFYYTRNCNVVVSCEKHACETFISRKNCRRTFLASFSWNIENTFDGCDGAVWAKAAIKIRWFQPTARARSPFVSRGIDSCAHSHFPPFLFEAKHVSPLVFIAGGNLRSKENNIPNILYRAKIDLTKRYERKATFFSSAFSTIGAILTLCNV